MLLIWDPDIDFLGEPEKRVVYGSRYDASSGCVSLPKYLDIHGAKLRAAYAAFIYDLGQQRINGQTLTATLMDDHGFSFWWMTSLAEKSPFKSPRIYDCLRLMALEHLFENEGWPEQLVLQGGDISLGVVLANLCDVNGIKFTHQSPKKSASSGVRSRLHRCLPWRVKAMLGLRRWLRRWPLRKLSSPAWFHKPHGLLFCSYFFNLDNRLADEGKFYSRQWGALPENLHGKGFRINWLHHMLLSPGIESTHDALALAKKFNLNQSQEGCHSFIESQLNLRVLMAALFDWWRVGRRAENIRRRLSFKPARSGLDLWPLLQEDWHDSTRGIGALGNCLWRKLFDRALGQLPTQSAAYYLWENQGWETAFLHAWRQHGHGRIIGVPHTTIAFWHLNNFDDPRLLETGAKDNAKPLPDCLAVNGPAAWQMFLNSGYPVNRMVPVEAVRFQYLNKKRPKFTKPAASEKLRVLMLGDYTSNQTQAMSACLASAIQISGNQIELTIKPHPATVLMAEDVAGLFFEKTEFPLEDIMHRFDLAFASNSSSAALDAWLYGLPVAVFLDDSTLNLSPLRGAIGARFVSNCNELALLFKEGMEPPSAVVGDFFWLDQDLHRWFKLLSVSLMESRE